MPISGAAPALIARDIAQRYDRDADLTGSPERMLIKVPVVVKPAWRDWYENETTGTITCQETTWYRWNYCYATTAATTASYDVNPWPDWNSLYTTTASSKTFKISGTLTLDQRIPEPTRDEITNYHFKLAYQNLWNEWNKEQQETEVQRAARIQREAELRRQAEEFEIIRQERVLVAETRSALLLKESLNAEQLREFESYQYFTVISADRKRRYRVRKGWSHNVERVDETGKRLHTLCAHPADSVPEFDNMLAQKLMLENCEEEFLKIANKGVAA